MISISCPEEVLVVSLAAALEPKAPFRPSLFAMSLCGTAFRRALGRSFGRTLAGSLPTLSARSPARDSQALPSQTSKSKMLVHAEYHITIMLLVHALIKTLNNPTVDKLQWMHSHTSPDLQQVLGKWGQGTKDLNTLCSAQFLGNSRPYRGIIQWQWWLITPKYGLIFWGGWHFGGLGPLDSYEIWMTISSFTQFNGPFLDTLEL